MLKRRNSLAMLVVAPMLGTMSVAAISESIPNAVIINDEGGPTRIVGSVTYTNPFFTLGTSEPLVILEDQTGFVRRDRQYVFPIESQVLGKITSDFLVSPFTYSVDLPQRPAAPLHDFTRDGQDDPGVMVYAVAYWSNTWGDPYLERRDQGGGGWSGAYASTLVSPNASNLGEYIGGKLLIYAPVPGQAFPIGYGDDAMLFTEDDPLVIVPQGYTIVDINQEPFTFDRSREPNIPLLEPPSAQLDDYSDLSFTAAFDALIELFRTEYAFTEYKGLDWDALKAQFRPRFEQAEASGDFTAYALALRDFTWAIPDGHVSSGTTDALIEQFRAETAGGIGLAIRKLDDGRTIASFVLNGSPAQQVGVQPRAEILAINDQPIDAWVAQAVAWSAPSSTPHYDELQRLRYATRFIVGREVRLRFRNPGGQEQSATMNAVAERDSFSFSSFFRGVDPNRLPVEFRVRPDGYMLITIASFSDDDRLSILVWERALRLAKEQELNGIIIDMRNNGGGSGFLARQMAAYFFQEELQLGNSGFYDKEQGQFVFEDSNISQFYLPPAELRWDGKVAVLVGPNCLSACEFFSYALTLQNRAAIVGMYPTGGLGGSVKGFAMPGGLRGQFTVGRAVDMQGNIHIEGKGVAPTVRVPVTEDTLFAIFGGGDPILDAAIQHLSSTP